MILPAYIIAIPANEIVVPTMIMVYMGAGVLGNADADLIAGPGTFYRSEKVLGKTSGHH